MSVTANKPLYNSIVQMKRMALEQNLKPPFHFRMTEDQYRCLLKELSTGLLFKTLDIGFMSGFKHPPTIDGVRIEVVPNDSDSK